MFSDEEESSSLTHQSRDGEVSGVHLLSEPVYFPPRVDEDDRLCDGQSLVQVTQRVQLPLLRDATAAESRFS